MALNRTQLDARKSETYPTFDSFQALADKINDAVFVAIIPFMPLLHDKFLKTRRIMKGDYIMTQERAKDLYMEMRYVTKEMIHNNIVLLFLLHS